MKNKYLEALRAQLMEFKAENSDIEEILSDYSQLYDDALDTKGSDEEVWKLLGDPKTVAYDLIDTLKIKKQKERNIKKKLIAITPFVSLMTFFILGFYFDLWHPGWLVFLLIPVTSILLSTRLKQGIIALSPFVAVITYMILGFGFNLWHPGWMIFFIIPLISIILSAKAKEIPVAISPFIAVVIFFILGEVYGLWNPGWLVFLMIPMIGILYSKNTLHKVIYELSFIFAIGFYLYMGYIENSWTIGGLGFLVPVIMGIIFGDIHILWNNDWTGISKVKALIMISSILGMIAAFVAVGILFNGWAYAWQFFLAIPVLAIILFDKFRMTAIMPFIAVVLFFSLGYFFNLFHISWLAFLLIPVTAIMENA
jgi:uncharacterized membrane protein